MGVDVTKSTRDVLAAYLRAEFAAEDPPRECVVLEQFPDAGVDLPPMAVSVSMNERGQPEQRYWEPAEYAQEVNPADPAPLAPTTCLTLYTYGKFKQPLQLDVWCKYAVQRDALVKRLNALLHRHPNETLNNDTHGRLGAWPELALTVAAVPEEGVPARVYFYRFQEVPLPIEMGDASQEGDWSANAPGMVEGFFVAQEVVARMNELDVTLGITDDPASTPVTETFTAEP